jgi:hypothetical protein
MTKKEAIRQTEQLRILGSLGFTQEQAEQLRLISITLRRWHEMECGINSGCIERDEATGKPFWTYYGGNKPQRHPMPDRETGALARLARIMATVPTLKSYIQTDPRGAALYILRPGDVPEGSSEDSCYSRGICVF